MPLEPLAEAGGGFTYPEDKFRRFLTDRGVSPGALDDETRASLMLCAGCLEGEGAAWETFFQRFRPFLYNVALRLYGRAAEAEELVADIIADFMERGKLAQYSGRGSFRGWLRSVVTHRFLDSRRRLSRTRLESMDDLAGGELPATSREDGCGRYYRRAMLEEVATVLSTSLKKLPEREAGFLNLYYFQGLNLAQAAQLLGVHESTASRWNARILDNLRRNVVNFLKKVKGWSPEVIGDFLERCLAYLAEKLNALKDTLNRGDFPCKPGEKARPMSDGGEHETQ